MRIGFISDTHFGHSGEITGKLIHEMLLELKEQNPDVILHTGDWGSTKPSQVKACMELVRSVFNDTVIVGNYGNHDLWNMENGMNLEETWNLLQQYKREFNITTWYEKDNILVATYQSWYKTYSPPSNDYYWMPMSEKGENVHAVMMGIADKDFTTLLTALDSSDHIKSLKKVIGTHFSPYPYRMEYDGMCGKFSNLEELVARNVEVVCYGHAHQFRNDKIDNTNTRVLVNDSDYNEPNFTIIEI